MFLSLPIFPLSSSHRRPSLIRFSRWNNENAEKFNTRIRTQKRIEDDIRTKRRFISAERIIQKENTETETQTSHRSPDTHSRRSRHGKMSKYHAVRHSTREADVSGEDYHEDYENGDSVEEAENKSKQETARFRHSTSDADVAGEDYDEDYENGDSVGDAENKSKQETARFRSAGTPSVPSRRSVPGKKSKYSKSEKQHPAFRRFGDVDVACKPSFGRYGDLAGDAEVAVEQFVFRQFGDADVAVEAYKYSGNGDSDRDSDVAVKPDFRRSGDSFRDADVAVERSRYLGNVRKSGYSKNSIRRSGNSVGDADVAVEPSRYSRNVKKSGKHPAFRRFGDSVRDRRDVVGNAVGDADVAVKPEVRVREEGVSYVVGNAPFEFMYSYTETPKGKPVRLREPLVAPFETTTMARPWTGRKPLAKKKLPEFDSFKLPPPHKKGVKPVQSPGPFLPGSGPKYVHSREEILGEPLTKQEIEEVVNGCRKSRRQMHMGRDGLTHNMLENIHAHWKRRRVCKIKCLGVCTVDMDNVRQQLEDKTGGKVIYGSGGIIYLFRGRNYNYLTRPRYPLMLWKPITPVYPRLVLRVPDGLTLEEASEMRKKGRNLIPICKLGKNGVYSDLVKHVREAFEACDLVRINCQGMNSSDYHKIGAKLKDLVPCVLISFEREHILMWRGREWTSSLPKLGDNPKTENPEFDIPLSSTSDSEDEGIATSFFSDSEDITCSPTLSESVTVRSEEDREDEGSSTEEDSSTSSLVSGSFSNINDVNGNEISSTVDDYASEQIELNSPWTEGVRSLLKEAIDNGAAIILDDSSLDSDIVFQTAVGLAKCAPPGLVFKGRARKLVIKKSEKRKTEDLKVEEDMVILDNKEESAEKNSYIRRVVMDDVKEDYIDVVPQGSLRVDELAKLLA